MAGTILVDTSGGITTIALNRPDRLNAWTRQMANEVRSAVGEAGNDPAVRCIVVTGAGRGFCAGADMDSLQQIGDGGEDGSRARADVDGEIEFVDAPGPSLEGKFPGRFGYLYDCPKPIIAAINGPCAGIGLIFALYSDLRFASAEAKFTTAFSQRGLIAEHGLAWLLPRLVGEAHALDLLFTARKFLGSEAEALGLVNKALPGEDLMTHVGEVADHLANQVSPRSVGVMKRQIRASYHQSFAASLTAADAEMEASFETFDFKEGVASFAERRAPAFQGR